MQHTQSTGITQCTPCHAPVKQQVQRKSQLHTSKLSSHSYSSAAGVATSDPASIDAAAPVVPVGEYGAQYDHNTNSMQPQAEGAATDDPPSTAAAAHFCLWVCLGHHTAKPHVYYNSHSTKSPKFAATIHSATTAAAAPVSEAPYGQKRPKKQRSGCCYKRPSIHCCSSALLPAGVSKT
jgi:hypothetical protein